MASIRKVFFICLVFVLGGFAVKAQKVGVMIMAHGGSQQWNDLVVKAAQPLTKKYVVSYAWGMGDPITLQKAVDELESKGVTKIIAVPLFISSHSMVIRQTEFLLGLRDKMTDPPMPSMDHSGGSHDMSAMKSAHEMASMQGGHNMSHGNAPAAELKPLKIKAELVVTPALDDNQIVASILRDRAAALSTNPSKETVVLVAHGPNGEEDNQKWIANLESLSQKIQKIQETRGPDFKQIFAVTVRDDADKAIFDQAKEQLRALVRQAGLSGTVIVVPVFLSSGGREHAVAERLEGLNYKWDGKALLPDARLSDFLAGSVNEALKKSPVSKR
ncbi:MAG TPA: CbiX/SirB N-terminal domain-containing protein [Ginsengibacter sp.]|nr:CbiX/SirB N-terminal domain-containing protein [Ginsengibacter sp.]HRP45512.1 CbiX/SirB N-terminal domain-containing protein [Ginsengibacter sp.]